MEESVEKYINLKASFFVEYFKSMASIHKKMVSPIEKIFYVEWHFYALFYPNKKYSLYPQFHRKEITGKYVVDFMLATKRFDTLIAIEIDGHDFHEKTKEQVKKDKERERFITKNVTKFLRFSGSEVYKNPKDSVNEVLNLIDDIKEDEK